MSELQNRVLWKRERKRKWLPVPGYAATIWLKKTREAKGWSIRNMASKANVSFSYYHKFEQGKIKVSEKIINRIKTALNIRSGSNK